MKKLSFINIILASAFLATSCNDLDLEQIDTYGSTGFWKTEAQAKGYVLGLNAQVRNYYETYWKLGEARGGFLKSGSTSLGTSVNDPRIKSQALTKDNTGVANWAGFYSQIIDINLGIKSVEEASYLSDADKKSALAQMHGLRAWYYFWLYRTYGGVPINKEVKVIEKTPTTAKDLYAPRNTPKEVMDFIKEDLQKSETYFQGNNNLQKSQWTKYATLMLKAEVYLWSAKVTTGDQTPQTTDIDVAKNALLEVKNSGNFSLLPNFADVFKYDNKENDEIIYVMPFLDGEKSNWMSSFLYNSNLFSDKFDAQGNPLSTDPLKIVTSAGIFRHEYSYELFKIFESGDTRREATFMDFYQDAHQGSPGLLLKKFLGMINSSDKRVFADDIPVYRYADVLLMLAEVANKKGEDPSPYINEIRKRAYGNESHAYTNGSFEQNELTILKERDKEFVAENKRWFDIVRMQDASGKPLVFKVEANYGETTPILPTTEEYKLLWPVNIQVLNDDPQVKQTPGYE